MRLIKSVNPASRSIQTEDLSKTFITRTLYYQSEFENEGRWLTFDLLCGRIEPGTAMWDYFCWVGIEAHELQWFRANTCATDVLGINHYITSQTFLDERVAKYPEEFRGGNAAYSRIADKPLFARESKYRGQPIVLSEVGGFLAIPQDVPFEKRDMLYQFYGSFQTLEELLNSIAI